jgi:hypothetical protein
MVSFARASYLNLDEQSLYLLLNGLDLWLQL